MKTEYKWLLALILIGILLRAYNLSFQIMNGDEIWTIDVASPSLSVWQIIVTSLSNDCNPPLYYLVAHFSMLVFGANAWAIRFPSVIFGVLLIPCMYLVGREYKDDLFGLLCAGFTALSYNMIFYSRYGRSYAMALVFAALCFYFFQRVLKGDNRAGIWFGVFAILAVYTHLFAAIPLGLMAVYLLWKRLAVPGVVLFGIGSLPLLNLFYVIYTTRVITDEYNDFGSSPLDVLTHAPLDVFAYSTIVIMPILVYSLWVHRSDLIFKITTAVSLITLFVMVALANRTPIIPHYIIFVYPMLMLPVVMFFYTVIREKGKDMHFGYFVVAYAILINEFIQIWFLVTIQRMWW
jgi:mannosyltransferase